MLVNRLGGFVVPFLAIYLTERRGASAAQAGLIGSLWGLGAIASGPVGGTLADRFGRRVTMAGGLAVGGAGMLALGFVERLPALGAGMLLLGFATETFRPAMQASIADLVEDPAARARAFGLVYWAVNLGFAVALVAAGALASVSYRLLFALDGATTLLFAGLILLKVPETQPAGARRGEGNPLAGLLLALGDRTLAAFIGLNFLFALLLWQGHMAFPIDLRAKGFSPAVYGALMALNGVVIVLVQPFVTRALGRRDVSRVLAAAGLLAGAGWGANAFARSVPLVAAGILVWTLGEIANNPTGAALVAELAPAHLRGRYGGAYSLSWASASAVGPFAGAWVLGRFGREALWGGCFALGLAVALGHLAAAPDRRRRLAGLARREATAPGPAPVGAPR